MTANEPTLSAREAAAEAHAATKPSRVQPSFFRQPFISYFALPAAALIALLAFYLSVFLTYRPYDIDNPWFLSFSYDTCVEHIYTDEFLNTHFPAGMDGTQLFGKIAAYTQYFFLSHAGWQQWPAVVLSSCFITGALALWGLQLSRLGYSRRFVLCFLVIAGLSEPFVAAANKARYEFLSFALISLGLLLVAYGRPFLGSFFAALAVEVEPMAIAGLIPIVVLAWLLAKNKRRLAAQLGAGFALAAACYLLLHPNIVSVWKSLNHAPANGRIFTGGFFSAYFFDKIRHIPECVCFLVAGAVYWFRRRTIANHYFGISSLALALFALAVPHGNAAYMIFAYPCFLAMALIAFQVDRRPLLILALAFAAYVPQQIVLIGLTRNLGYRTSDVQAVSQAIQEVARRRNLNDATLNVFGDYRLWFAHPHLYRGASLATVPNMAGADLFLCYNAPPQPLQFEPGYLLYCGDMTSRMPLELADSLSLRNHQIFIYARKAPQ